MGTDNTSDFKVKNLKKQKGMKKKHKSEDFTNETSSNVNKIEKSINKIGEINEHNAVDKKLKETKQKLKKLKDNNNMNENSNEAIKCKQEKGNTIKIKQKHSDGDMDDEEMPPKKRLNITHASSSLEETAEIDKTDSKVSKQFSKRQIKREKAEMRENEKKMASKMEAMKKGHNYVSKWKYARSEWKFEKLRQTWLIDNLLDQTFIPDDIFPIVLEYFEGCKGMAREQLLKKGMDVIRKLEENEENKDEIESITYQRARKLLQALPTET